MTDDFHFIKDNCLSKLVPFRNCSFCAALKCVCNDIKTI